MTSTDVVPGGESPRPPLDDLPAYSDDLQHPAFETTWRFLGAAHGSVSTSLVTYRRTLVDLGGDEGMPSDSDRDQLRAAIVFAGAGVDAVLKQLIRDTLPILLTGNKDAQEKFQRFVGDRLRRDDAPAILAGYLTAPDVRSNIIEDYIRWLTGSSLQSVEQVNTVAGALAANDASLRQNIRHLQSLFQARNEVTHELDLQDPQRHGQEGRRERQYARTRELCNAAIRITALMVEEVARKVALTDE